VSRFLYPVINGIAPSWADVAVRLTPTGGSLIEMGEIQSIKSSRKVERGRQKEGGRTIKRTTGEVTYEASITLYLEGLHKLIDGLGPVSPLVGNQRRLGLATFLVTQQWSIPNDSRIFERRIKGCMLNGDSIDAAEGTDAQLIEIPLDPLEIVDVKDGVEYLMI
jgi:hypothetical protein